MSVFDTLSSATRAALESADVHDDLGLQTLGGAQLDEWVTDPGDRVQIEFLAKRRAGLPMVALTALPMGLAHEGALEGGQRVVVARSYTNEVPWASVGEEPGPLVKGFRACDWTPTQQRHGSCASHTTGLGLELRGYSTPCDRDVSPSRASLHLLSGEVGGHGPGEGRSYKTMQEVLFEHGHLTEKELPTGHDDFEEQQVLTRAQKRLARARLIHGAGWVVDNRDRLNFALDCVSGRVTGEPVGLQVAVEVYGSWQRCYRAGVIRRHSASEGELLGLHALLVVVLCSVPCAGRRRRSLVSRSVTNLLPWRLSPRPTSATSLH